ncbi:transcriptional regulator family: Homeodomain [Paecilomyces variotii]|nr:transcriptional regulator family: Homeodomain [Paecilomyces variotii]KAJ9234826.1 transcriptional regulator family: Homeodomain [Paecilomyces variotii]KAJ9266186.1 transcriptional regulator family: Homeodomain [Paecilomyces variotii]KAJ9372600.1 transcriptional regulator family: Homeodomain [Paecilomyces variotii]
MGDQEPSGAASSSPPPPTNASESAALNYAFLVHSQKTLTQNLPPRVDNKLLARQKRRRTSPEDHAILEAEYRRNPKPDKAARASIVSRVALGEKEVQIWFQNRRQNDRRKSKPLQPHELLAPRSTSQDSSQHSGSDDNVLAEKGTSSGAEHCDGGEQATDSNAVTNSHLNASFQSSFDSGVVSADNEEVEPQIQSSQTSVASKSSSSIRNAPGTVDKPEIKPLKEAMTAEEQLGQSPKRKRSFTDICSGESETQHGIERTGVQRLPGVKTPPSLRISLSFDGEAMVRKEGEMTPSPLKGRSAVRISMSSDGEALIRTGNEPSPSKARTVLFPTPNRSFRAGGLRRSNSAVSLGAARPDLLDRDVRNKAFGRSRDARNWELYCDTDARSALSTPSSSQGTPNAAKSGLMRSRSNRSLSRSFSGRENALAPRSDLQNRVAVPLQSGEKRRKLSRTVSSLGRLQSDQNISMDKSPLPRKDLKSYNGSKYDVFEDIDPGDSDKENWVPGTQQPQVRRRAVPRQNRRPILKEAGRTQDQPGKSSKVMTDGRHARSSRNQGPSASKENALAPEVDEEVSAFMSAAGGPSQEEDLDCIQGLLSLSQGAWR